MPFASHLIPLPDGRELALHDGGEPGGTAVVLCGGAGLAGTTMLPEPPGGARLIAVDRPGLGRSTHDPGRTYASFAADVSAGLVALGVGPFAALGFSQGAPFALALAAHGAARAVALAAPQDDLGSPVMTRLAAPEVTAFVAVIGADPDGAEADLSLDMNADTLCDLVLRTAGPRDRAFYTALEREAGLRESLAAGFAKGADGYARDTRLALLPWPPELLAVAVPVRLWCGADDRSPVHSPDNGATLVRRLPNATRRVIGGGGTLLWTDTAAIVNDLVAIMAAQPTASTGEPA